MQARGYREILRRPFRERSGIWRLRREPLKEGFSQFLGKQRYAVSPFSHSFYDFVRQLVFASCAAYEFRRILAVETIEFERDRFGLAKFARVVLRSARRHQENWQLQNALSGLLEQFFGRRVDPLYVLDDQQHWARLGEAL